MIMWQRVALVMLSAGMGILVFPPFGLWWLSIIAWIPLLLALPDAKPSHALYLGLLHGVVFYGVTMSWLVNVFDVAPYVVVPLVFVMGLFTAFFARGYAVATARYRTGWVTSVFAAVWWLACEFFRSEIFYLKFPWMTPGLGLGPTWVSPLMGVSGAGFLIIFGGACCAQWKKKNQLVVGSVVLLVMLVSAFLQTKKEMPQNTSVRVLAVQAEGVDVDQYISLTRGAEGEHDLIIWPEYATLYDVRKSERDWNLLKDLCRDKNAVLVLGTQTAIDDVKWYNTALTMSSEGVIGEHYKNHPVHFFDDGEPGAEARALDTRVGRIGTSICFDNDYQDVVRRMTMDGAEFFAIPSMDEIKWGDKEHHQHAELFRHRAAENGRWIAVAASSGKTQIIDSNGNRVISIPIVEQGTLSLEVARGRKLTIYTRFGWLFPWVVMGVGTLWVVTVFWQGVMEKRPSRDTRLA